MLLVVPSRVQGAWRAEAGTRGWVEGRQYEVVTHHRMSRGGIGGRWAVVVVDEAHRFRHGGTRRAQALMGLASESPVVLVTATPVCRGAEDLRQLLAYFLSDRAVRGLVGMGLADAFEEAGRGAFDLTELLESVVIRRWRADFGEVRRPKVRFEVERYEAGEAEAWLWQHLEQALRGMGLAAFEGTWPRGLFVTTGLRQWESGAGALEEALGGLAHYFERWLDAAARGRWLAVGRFREVFEGVSARQGVMGFVYGERAADEGRLAVAREGVAEDLEVVREVLARVRQVREEGGGVEGAVARLVGRERGEKWLVFTGYQGAARALYRRLCQEVGAQVGVGLVTGGGAEVTGAGRERFEEVMSRFVGDVGRRDGVGVLVATDCLSEGVNLQRCSRLVLADLPYSPLKLEQRVGRVVRPGGSGGEVRVYLPRPQQWADTLGMRRRLAAKIGEASRVGVAPRLAGSVGLGSEAGEEEVGVLEAMTLEDRLRERLRGEEAVGGWMRVGEGEVERVLARVRVCAGVERTVWVSAGASGVRVGRLVERLGGLVALGEARAEVRPWEPRDEACWEAVQGWVRRRRAELEGARLAPAVLGRGAVQVRVWRVVSEGARGGELGVGLEGVGRYRQRVLREQPPGVLRRWEGLLALGGGARALWEEVQRLEVQEEAPVRVEVVAALGWGRGAESRALARAGLFEELPVGVGEEAQDEQDEDAAVKKVERQGGSEHQCAERDFCDVGQGLALGVSLAQNVEEGLASVHGKDGEEVEEEPEGVDHRRELEEVAKQGPGVGRSQRVEGQEAAEGEQGQGQGDGGPGQGDEDALVGVGVGAVVDGDAAHALEHDGGGAEAAFFEGGGVSEFVKEYAEEEDGGPHQLVGELLGGLEAGEDEEGYQGKKPGFDVDGVAGEGGEFPAGTGRLTNTHGDYRGAGHPEEHGAIGG
ncbi:hypothetical protein DL240_15630 [Lujinxingia litoralis]|uniref:Helicase C-terminal domain-containing protein n=1 Tax=Lujinxingia litoralis TaxID=2211119 RepID=A0A328C605_9DELT|nr:hypothetical protein DL240_15630 [Lujinxingia litoralis]